MEKEYLSLTDLYEILNDNKIDLMNELLENESPISPFGYFSITGGAFLSALTTIITYLIVLIQFKLSE